MAAGHLDTDGTDPETLLAPASAAEHPDTHAAGPATQQAPENRLGAETSPYLRQHRHDPVDWYPWGPEAFARAKELDRPLFLSIGYSACHWCHVMGHESFADETTAAEMNEQVVAVKVDREERPDVDAVYMEAVQAASGHGGWPMSVFATPDGRPFYAGTYFPNRPGRGSPTFRAVLAAVSEAWATQRDAVIEQADGLSDAVARRLAPPVLGASAGGETAAEVDGTIEDGAAVDVGDARGPALVLFDSTAVASAMESACRRLGEMADPTHGGFGRAPKFPQPLFLDLMLRAHVEGIEVSGSDPLEVALGALEAMASGGIWDHLGGGFSRYSVDREWLVPHFEKMLYDQALVGRAYLHAWQITGDPRWRQVLDEIVAYVLRDLGLPGGGIASAEDADSEGEEGLFYTWQQSEIEATLGPELAPAAVEWWGVRTEGNFEGRSILFRATRGDLLRPAPVDEARRQLLEARSGRVRPGRDDKILTEWNAMMCATLAEAALATGETTWREAAEALGVLLLERSRRAGDGRVLRCPQRGGGQPELLGYSADAAWVVEACVRLAECTGEAKWLTTGREVADQLLELFEDAEAGGLFTTGNDAERLVVRPRELYDNVTPSALSVAVGAQARVGAHTGADEYGDAARRLLSSAADLLTRAPTAVAALIAAADLLGAGVVEVAITGARLDLVDHVGRRWLPRTVLAWETGPGGAAAGAGGRVPATSDDVAPSASATGGEASARSEGGSPLLEGRAPGMAYVCRAGACRLPVATTEGLDAELAAALVR
jgi:uncharacterized protein YyaL (SSP411 family)